MKRVLSLVLSLVLVLGMMPTFAATMSGAEELYTNGFITGSNGDLMVNKSLTRAEMAVVLSELFGVKVEAMNYAVPSSFSDSNSHWAASYIAYGQKAGWFNGYPDGTYKPEGVVSGNELAAFVLNALGYQGDYTFAEAIEFAVTMGIDVPNDAAILRGDAFEVVWAAVNTPAKGSDVALGVELGRLEAEEEEVVLPDELEVDSVDADNLIQAVVVFNQPVDEDTAEDVYNYDFEDAGTPADADLQDDGVTVILTLDDAVDQDTDDVLTIEGVKTEDKSMTMDDDEFDVNFIDITQPKIEDVEVVGISTIKVTFSEPIDVDTADEDLFEIDGGDINVDEVMGQKNNTELMVTLLSDLESGRITVAIDSGIEDYSGLTALGKSFRVDVDEDTTAPTVIGYDSADQREVTLIWSEDIELVDGSVDLYYHTNSANTIMDELVDADIDGNEMTLIWDEDFELPSMAYVYVGKEAVQDLWENENTKQVILVEIDFDAEPPVLTSIDVEAEDEIVLTFNEDIDESTVSRSDFTVLDEDDDEIDAIITVDSVVDDEITLSFSDMLDDGEYTLVVENIEDMYGNEIDEDSMDFEIENMTGPDLGAIDATLIISDDDEFTIKVDFDEAMATSGEYAMTNIENYKIRIDGDWYDLGDIDNVDLNAISGNESLEIIINASDLEDATGETEITADSDMIKTGRLADEAGNLSDDYASGNIVIAEAGTVDISSIELIGEYKLLVTFDGKVTYVESDDFIFSFDGDELDIASISKDTNSDGDTEVTFTISSRYFDGFSYDASDIDFETLSQSNIETHNGYDELMTAYNSFDIDDKLAPILSEDADTDDDDVDDVKITDADEITLNFTEDIDEDYVSFSSFKVGSDDEFDITDISVDGSKIIITVDLDGEELEAGVAVTQNAAIRDMAGNEVDNIETEIGDFDDNYEY